MLTEALVLLYLVGHQPRVLAASSVALASHTISMEDRYNNAFVNDVFKYNILLALRYMDGSAQMGVEAPFTTQFTLKPGEEFAFHKYTLPDYSKNVVRTMNSGFASDQGYKSDGFLVGDGVCHLASLMYWVAKDAGIEAYAPSNHNFAKINDIDPIYGVAIESPMPGGNLYIVNNLNKPVTFTFDFDGTNLTATVSEEG